MGLSVTAGSFSKEVEGSLKGSFSISLDLGTVEVYQNRESLSYLRSASIVYESVPGLRHPLV